MQDVFQNLGIGILGSLVAVALTSIILALFRSNLFSADKYIKKKVGKLHEIARISKDPTLLYFATLRDVVIMNLLFFADSALWNMGEIFRFSFELQRIAMLIEELGIFSIRLFTVVILMIGLWVALNAVNRINRVIAYRKHIEEGNAA